MYSRDRNLQAATSEAANTLQPMLEDRLKGLAKAASWPEKVISALTVDFDGSNLIIKYPDNMAEEIDDLEYGKPYGLPNPVFYPFITRNQDLIQDVLALNTLDFIMETEEVF